MTVLLAAPSSESVSWAFRVAQAAEKVVEAETAAEAARVALVRALATKP